MYWYVASVVSLVAVELANGTKPKIPNIALKRVVKSV